MRMLKKKKKKEEKEKDNGMGLEMRKKVIGLFIYFKDEVEDIEDQTGT